MFVGDKTKKTVRILVRLRAGTVVRPDGAPLPKVLDGTLADLVLPASHIINEAERLELEAETPFELLPAPNLVFAGLSRGMIEEKVRGLIRPQDLPTGYGYSYLFAEVRLKEPLVLRLRGGDKEPILEDCKCSIPMLGVEARSLNHAFTLLSTAFETKRISHTGNVFTRVFCHCEKGKDWRPLNELRGHIEHLLPV